MKGPDLLAGDEPAKLFEATVPLEEKRRIVFDYYRRLVDEYDKLRHPTGEKDAPARTCRDLAASRPDLPDGLYWIDPNEGNARDAVQVECRMAVGASCLLPSPNQVPKKAYYFGRNKHAWLSELEDGYQIRYKIDRIQLTFLQLLSSRAVQNITYHCRNSVAFLDSIKQTHRRSIRLMAHNDLELRAPEGDVNPAFTFTALFDGCKDRSDKWSYTILQYKSDKAQRLPIVDIAPRDIGLKNQEFGVEVGPACFY